MDAALTEKSDEEQLAFATERECVLYTFNVSDFHRPHTKWISTGRNHAGIILAPQQRYPPKYSNCMRFHAQPRFHLLMARS